MNELTAADLEGTIESATPWLILPDGTEIPPVPSYRPRTWWQRLLRRPLVQDGWLTGPFTVADPQQVVRLEWRPTCCVSEFSGLGAEYRCTLDAGHDGMHLDGHRNRWTR